VRASLIPKRSGIPSEIKFIEIAMEMLAADMMERIALER